MPDSPTELPATPGSALPSWAQLRDELESEVQATLKDMMYPSNREDVIWRMFLAYRDAVICNGWPDRQPADSAPRDHGCELALKDMDACQHFLAAGQLDFLKPNASTLAHEPEGVRG